MTAEELEAVLKAVNTNRPQQTMIFNGPIGQQIAHVDKIEAHFDKDMKMEIAGAEEVELVEAESEDGSKEGSFPLTNLIFNPRLFDSSARLERLRSVIACAISMGSNHREEEDKNEYTLNLQQKSEWYYLMQAFVEAEVTRGVPTTADLYKQMKAWFPEVAVLEGDGTEDELTRKLTGSISAEKTKWKEMGTDKSVPLKEMVTKNQASERMKPERCRDLYKAAYTGLCVKLKELKEEITSTKDDRR